MPRNATQLRLESLEERRVLTAVPYGATELDLGEYLLGDVAVTPVFFESNGQIDQSTENWSQLTIQDTLNKINEGLDWWVDTLDAQQSVHSINFVVDTEFAETPAATRYEPISRISNDYSLYVSEFLASQGFSSGSLEIDMKAFNHAQRLKHDTNWAFTMIVVPSLNDSDGEFASGGSFRRAFAFAGGLFMVVPSTRPASTFAHELGHIFWARDEYPGGGNYFQRRGYYNTQNLNAFDNPTPGFQQEPSIMASGSLLNTAYAANTSPESTLAQLGWQDSDNDGIFDVLDVPHRLSGVGSFDSANSTYHFEGFAHVQTLPNLNTSGLRNDITINRIRQIEYRFDGAGEWTLHSSPDAYEADLNLTIPVPSSATQIEIRARDSQTTVTSNVFVGRLDRADATQVPGINGFAWIDQNENGLRDVGEYGQEFWTVELVDGSGEVVDLRTTIEPDDYPDGQLNSGFSSEVTLRTNGSDTDGRIGVFFDSEASTGTKTFRGYSRLANSYVSSWTGDRRLQADFATPTSVVLIDAIGTSSQTLGRLEAYNTAGELLGRYTTKVLGTGETETMMISRGTADIAYVIASGHANTAIKLDHLRFGPESVISTGPFGSYAFPSLAEGSYNVRVTPSTQGFVPFAPNSGQQSANVIANTATSDVDFGFRPTSSPWQNPANPNDVNDDSFVSAIDVLLIVNDINSNEARDLSGSSTPFPPYIDVNGDNFVSALDVLLVVNFINSNGSSEGESGFDDSLVVVHEEGGFASPSSSSDVCVPHQSGSSVRENAESAGSDVTSAMNPLAVDLSFVLLAEELASLAEEDE